MAYPDCKVGFEYQGAYHASPEQMRKDAARFNELQHNGWTIIMVTADDLRTEESRRAFIEMVRDIVNRQRHLHYWLAANDSQ